jgi:glycosyltransferase involved in cell wall biosynthesis
MKTLLYIGNKTSNTQKNPTAIDVLGELLCKEDFNVILVSRKKNKLLRFIEMSWSVVKYSKKADYILIDTYSTLNFWYSVVTSQLARILNCKYLPILHGGNLPDRLKKNPKISRLIFENAYKNIAPSNYLHQIFTTQGYKNTTVIPNAIEIKNYPFNVSKNYEAPTILWVRAFSEIYNPMLALRVFHEIQKQYPNAYITMVGNTIDGSFAQCESYAIKHKLKVAFTGKLEKKEWIQLAKTHNCFINTSKFDNMPVSVIEAMALGLPIVSTRVGGIPYFLTHQENALLVANDSVNEMIDAIEYLQKNESDRNKIIHNARKFAEQLDWNIVKNQWLDLLI